MTTTLQKIPLRQVSDVKGLLMNDQARQQLAMVAAAHMKPERMMRLVANAVRTTPKLGECEPMSLLGALMTCASLGLEPNTVLGHAYLIPFKNNRKGVTEVQIVIGYKGLIDLARRSGHITSLSAGVHYSDDELWDYEDGTDARLRHRPGPQEGDKMHAWAVAKFREGGFAMVAMPWHKVMKIRDGSQGWQTAVKFGSKEKSPWFTHEDEMAAKTAVRALSKMLPLSTEFADAMQVDEAKVDHRAFALDPTRGITIEGEAIEEEQSTSDTNVQDHGSEAEKPAPAEKAEAKAAPAAERKAAPKAEEKPKEKAAEKAQQKATERKPDPEPESDAAAPEEAAIPVEVERIVGRVLEEFDSNASVAGDVEAILEFYGEQLEMIRDAYPAAYAKVTAAADEARERLA